MRYSEDKIKEAILHPDLDVRDAAIRYFYSSTTLDFTLMPLSIEAIEKYGRTKAFSRIFRTSVSKFGELYWANKSTVVSRGRDAEETQELALQR